MDALGVDGGIAFVCAMPMEMRPLVRPLSLRRTDRAGLPLRAGTLDGVPVFAIVTGIGTKLATTATERLLDAVAVDRVVVVGVTGALDGTLPIGSLVLPEVVVDSATGAEHRPAALGGGVARGTMWTTDELLSDPDVLARLRDQGVVSLDMETAAIAEVCEQCDVPWSVFRAISDRATDEIVGQVFHLTNRDGTPNVPAVVRYLVGHPTQVPRLARLGRGAMRAAEVAAEAAVRACRG
ncbi:MAG: hypothetical protein WKF43_10995 [Acidimicrobiales bacterium]